MTKPELEERLASILEDYGEEYWNSVEFASDPRTAESVSRLMAVFTEYAQTS